MIASLIALGLATSTTLTAQETKYHPRYVGEAAAKDQKEKSKIVQHKQENSTFHYARTSKMKFEKDPKAIAINKTVALDKKVGLTHKQEKKVQRLYKKEAKQMVKLQELRKENRLAMRDILTKEQLAKAKQHRGFGEHKKYRKPGDKPHQYRQHRTTTFKQSVKPTHMIVIKK